MYGFGGVCLSEVMLSISELSVVGMGGWTTERTHFMVGPGRGLTKILSRWIKVASHFTFLKRGENWQKREEKVLQKGKSWNLVFRK